MNEISLTLWMVILLINVIVLAINIGVGIKLYTEFFKERVKGRGGHQSEG